MRPYSTIPYKVPLWAVSKRFQRITDADRINALLDGGYLPRFIKEIDMEHATEAVDWALVHQFAPAYWRPANDGELSDHMGRVVDKPSDRKRIDQYIRNEIPGNIP